MSKLGDRLGSKLGPDARSILDAGRDGDNPTSADRARVKRALMRTIAASTALGATSAAGAAGAPGSAGAAGAGAAVVGIAAKGTSLSLGIKLLGVVALAALAFGGVVLERTASPDPAATQPISTSTASPAVESSNQAPALLDPPSTAPVKVAIPGPARADQPVAAEPVKAAPPRPRSPVVTKEAIDTPAPEPEEIAPVAAPPVIPAEDPLAAETRRLREAHGALQAGDPQKALALLGEQGGQLGEERAAARVLALCQMGKVGEMEAARATFLREHPRSPLADRVRSGCAPSIAK